MTDKLVSSHPKVVPFSSGSNKDEEKEAEKVTEPSYEPSAPFLNRLKLKKHTT